MSATARAGSTPFGTPPPSLRTLDNSFSGFPGCRNMVVLGLPTIEPGFGIIPAAVAARARAPRIPRRDGGSARRSIGASVFGSASP
ncbi:MAG: hypothetical protein H5U15_06395 [Roseovarius sp.]|nr:hypothetical protein [Roseovarius sp.]